MAGSPERVDGLPLPGDRDRWLPAVRIAVVVALVATLAGAIGTVGADARWLAALGGTIADRGTIPDGVPFAAAPTYGWPNVLVLAELTFHGLEGAFGDRGLLAAQIAAVAAGLAILARDARSAGAPSFGVASALALAAFGAAPSLAIARVQLFSLVLFPLLVLLLRSDARAPSRRLWLAVPLIALWSNLHGAVLSGLAVLFAYLLLERGRRDPRTAIAVGAGATLAVCLTPAGVRTVDYYHGLITNLAAARHVGLWAPLGASPADALLVLAAAALLVRLRGRRPPAWELAVIAGLAVLTVDAARSGVWLLFFLVAPAAARTRMRREWIGLLPVGAVAALALLGVALARSGDRREDAIVREAITLAHGTPILADGELAERVALAGGRVWVANPLDAFSRADQGRYLDWIAGRPAGQAALRRSGRVVVAVRGSQAAALTLAAGARRAGGDARTEIILQEPSKR